MICHLLLALVALLFAVDAIAGDLERGIRAYRNGDYALALEHWEPLARAGRVDAQVYLGWLYGRGLGVEMNFATSARWYRLAAEQGDPNAQYELGLLYELGQGVTADYWEAEHWYGLAIDQGFCPGELSASGRLDQE
jgi:TPR repeat protein